MIGSRQPEFINQVVSTLSRESDALLNELIALQYYSRGAISRDDAYSMTPGERQRFNDFLEKKFEEANKLIKGGVSVFV